MLVAVDCCTIDWLSVLANRLRLVDEHDLEVVSVDESDDFDEATDESDEAGVRLCRLSGFLLNDVLR